MPKHEFLETLPSYAVGALRGAGLERMEAHLRAGCDLCESELQGLSLTVSRLPLGLADHPVPAGLKEKLRSRIEREFPARKPQTPKSPVNAWMAAAAVMILVVSGALLWRQQAAVSELQSRLAQQRSQIEKFDRSLASQKKEIQWLRDPAVQLALLSGLELAPGAKARMIWNPVEQKGILYAQALPALTSDRSYQLWIIGDAGPVSGGIVEPDASGRAVLSISRIVGMAKGNLQFAVTIEPHGGVPKPTGSMVLAGKPI